MRYKRVLKILVYLLMAWFFGHIVYTIIDGLSDENKSADLAIILGNKVNIDGTLSKRLEKRLECGLNLYKTGRVKKILVSGGLGKEGFYEGTKMKDFLTKHGIPDSLILIIVDNSGNNTTATVNNALKLRDSLHYKSIIVVSQYFHLTRTKMLFRKRDFDEVSSVSPNYFELRDMYSLAREFFAYYLHVIDTT